MEIRADEISRIIREQIKDYEGSVVVEINQEITEDLASAIQAAGIERVKIRSVLTCESKRGVCALCYGRDLATGKVVELGMAVGVALCGLLTALGVPHFPPDIAAVYLVDHIPLRVQGADLALVVGLGVAEVLLAALLPARRAASRDPVATDAWALRVLEKVRAEKGLSAIGDRAKYVASAAKMGLGISTTLKVVLRSGGAFPPAPSKWSVTSSRRLSNPFGSFTGTLQLRFSPGFTRTRSPGDSCSSRTPVTVGLGSVVKTGTDVIFLGTAPRYDAWENGP